VLIPLSLLYSVIAAVHRWAYRSGLMKTAALPRPVVSIGNIAVGGGGKTPLTMWLSETLKGRGKVTGVLTRGYGRSGDLNVVADPEHDWKYIGDEPALMIRKVRGLPVAVSKNRHHGGEEILKGHDVDLFILDDGFGHHALHKDLEVVLIDDNRRFGSGRLLPAGILREPVQRLRDAKIIVVTKAADIDLKFEEEVKKYTDAPVLWADYRPDRLVQRNRRP
jgi:tetraacyldisaccharide 4'-kinase